MGDGRAAHDWGRLAVLIAVAGVVFVLARWAAVWPALMVTAIAVAVANATLIARERRRVAGLARAINAFIGDAGYQPVEVAGSVHWQHLAVAVNALGAAYERRGSKLQLERPWRRGLVDAIAVPALLFSAEETLLAANAPARALLQLGTGGRLTATQALRSSWGSAVHEAIRTDRAVSVQIVEGDRDLLGTASPVGDEVLLVLTDRTEQRRLGLVRRDFVANASHELKSPVAAVASLAEALDAVLERDPPRARQLTTSLLGEVSRLGALVRDLLDLRRLEASPAGEREAVDLGALVASEVERVGVAAGERGVDVHHEAVGRPVVVGEYEDLRLIVANLLDNAVLYNRPGGRVDVVASREDGNAVLRVADTGIGIAGADHGRVFERFYRVDVARSRESGGTGLGLALVKHAVDRLGGRLVLDSLLGEGTTVTVSFPLRTA